MKTAPLPPAAVQWHEGMLLAPHHFQQFTARQDALLHYHFSAATPYHWGIGHLEIDNTLLLEGVFRVVSLEAILPDGLIVAHREGDADLEVDLSPHEDEMKSGGVMVHLCVPALRGARLLERYRSVEGAPVADENTGEGEVPIPRLVPRLTLVAGERAPAKYVSFPLARIAYRGETIARTDFIPPTLSVNRRSSLFRRCADIAARLREKAAFLAEKVAASDSAVEGPMLVETRLLIRSLIAALPPFEAVLHTGRSHPFPLYLGLCGLVGQVAGMGASTLPPVLPAYDHNDLETTFREAADFVTRVVNEAVTESHTGVPFTRTEDGFSLHLQTEWYDHRLTIGVRTRPGVSEEQVAHWMDRARIGSAGMQGSLADRRILGARRRRIHSEGELIPVRGMLLFAVDARPTDGTESFIQPDEPLIIAGAPEAADADTPAGITLYVKNPT